MALTITKLKMWKDPGYTKGCVELPPLASKKLPTPDFTSGTGVTYRPKKNSTLTALELPLNFTELFEMSYLYIEASDGAGSLSLFGWVDSIEQTATSDPAVLIKWSVDWWRSYSGLAQFQSGRIVRATAGVFGRPYPTQPRKWVMYYKEKIGSEDDNYPYNVIVVYNRTVRVNPFTITQIEMLTFPMSWNMTGGGYQITYGGATYEAPSPSEVFQGKIDELLNLDSNSIIGIFVSPISPGKNATDIVQGSTIVGRTYPSFAYRVKTEGYKFNQQLSRTYMSGDYFKTVIVDPYGAVVYTMPWGNTADYISMMNDLGTTGCNLIVSPTSNQILTEGTGADRGALGLLATIPLIPLPLNSNAYTSYVYSGQREYDKKMKEIQRNAQMVSGIASSGMKAGAGAVEGASAGGVVGAVTGAVSGSVGSLVGTGVNYIASGYFNEQMQEAKDELYSNQASSIIQGAGGSAFMSALMCCRYWYIVQLAGDTDSHTEYFNDITTYGSHCDLTVTSNLSNYIPSTVGGIQILNLVVTGAIPPQAKQFIKERFANGVRIIERNPTGVVP